MTTQVENPGIHEELVEPALGVLTLHEGGGSRVVELFEVRVELPVDRLGISYTSVSSGEMIIVEFLRQKRIWRPQFPLVDHLLFTSFILGKQLRQVLGLDLAGALFRGMDPRLLLLLFTNCWGLLVLIIVLFVLRVLQFDIHLILALKITVQLLKLALDFLVVCVRN